MISCFLLQMARSLIPIISTTATSYRCSKRQVYDGSVSTISGTRSDHCFIQSGASIVYVKEQMGHSSIQVTVDTYGHLIPGADISWMDRVDAAPQTDLNPTQTEREMGNEADADSLQPTLPAEVLGGGGWTRTSDLRIMRLTERTKTKTIKGWGSAKQRKVKRNLQLGRN